MGYLREKDELICYDVINPIQYIFHKDTETFTLVYVDYFFQNLGIGSELIEFARKEYDVRFLWAIEKNTDAIRFYEAHGFLLTEVKKFEEGTTEYLVMMERRTGSQSFNSGL